MTVERKRFCWHV